MDLYMIMMIKTIFTMTKSKIIKWPKIRRGIWKVFKERQSGGLMGSDYNNGDKADCKQRCPRTTFMWHCSSKNGVVRVWFLHLTVPAAEQAPWLCHRRALQRIACHSPAAGFVVLDCVMRLSGLECLPTGLLIIPVLQGHRNQWYRIS